MVPTVNYFLGHVDQRVVVDVVLQDMLVVKELESRALGTRSGELPFEVCVIHSVI